MHDTKTHQNYVVCIKTDNCDDLEILKIYRVLPDEKAADKGLLRVIDESGEDYLYPENYFIYIKLPEKVEAVFNSQQIKSTA